MRCFPPTIFISSWFQLALAFASAVFFCLRASLQDLVMQQIVSSFLFHVALSLFFLLLYLCLDIHIDYFFSVESSLHI